MSNPKPDQIDWSQEPFKSVSDAVVAEVTRTAVAAKFLPPHGPLSSSAAVPKEIITVNNKTLSMNQGATTPIIEIRAQFTLTGDQYNETNLGTAITLATRGANLLAQAQDVVIFQGKDAKENEFFKNNPVILGSTGNPFLDSTAGLASPPPQITIDVPPKTSSDNAGRVKYGERTSSAVSQAYSELQKRGHNGPYALVLHSDIYADTIEPLEDTLIMPADRIKFFVTEIDAKSGKDIVRFYGSGALPKLTGLFMSLGGEAVDLVVGYSPGVRFVQQQGGADGGSLFEVYESFALRLKDLTAVVLLQFKTTG